MVGRKAPIEDSRIVLALDESIRALEQQAASLDRLHIRAGVLLSAAAITTGLFGAQLLTEGSLTCLSWLALVAFTGVGASALYTLWPRSGWEFTNSASTLLGVWVDDENANVDKMRRDVAVFNHQHWATNQNRLQGMYLAFQIGSALLAVEVILWLVDLGSR